MSACASSDAPVAPVVDDITIVIERGAGVPPGSLYLKPIPGGLLGKSADDELFRSRPGAEQMSVSATALSARLAEHALLVRSDDLNPGELVSPRELGMVRIGTFYEPTRQDAECDSFRTRLTTDRRASALLVYVDRPGSVRGLRYTQPYITDYRLDFPAAGIYLITLRMQATLVMPRTVRIAGPISAKVKAGPCSASPAADAGKVAARPEVPSLPQKNLFL